MRRFASLVVAAAVTASLQAASSAAPNSSRLDRGGLLAALRHIERRHPFSGSVLLMKDGKVVLAASFGYADRERRQPARLGTRYRISGLTGLFTWIGLFQ